MTYITCAAGLAKPGRLSETAWVSSLTTMPSSPKDRQRVFGGVGSSKKEVWLLIRRRAFVFRTSAAQAPDERFGEISSAFALRAMAGQVAQRDGVDGKWLTFLAPQVRFELTTLRLTGGKSVVSRALPGIVPLCRTAHPHEQNPAIPRLRFVPLFACVCRTLWRPKGNKRATWSWGEFSPWRF